MAPTLTRNHFIYNTPFTIPQRVSTASPDVLLENKRFLEVLTTISGTLLLATSTSSLWDPLAHKATNTATSATRSSIRHRIMTNDAFAPPTSWTRLIFTRHPAGTLPAVSFVKPSGWVDGHPASSKFNLFEASSRKSSMPLRATRNSGRALRSHHCR